MWTIGDILDIVREGVPFSDINTLNVSMDASNYQNMSISMLVCIPLDKAIHLSMTAGPDLVQNLNGMWHPELSINGNATYYGHSIPWSIDNNFVKLHLTISLVEANISQTANKIRDSNFYSVFEAALTDDKD